MRVKNLLWISLVAILLTSVVMTGTVMSPTSARMYVDPPEVKSDTEYPTGSTFTVNVSVADVANIYGWEFALDFNPALLQVQSHVNDTTHAVDDLWVGNGTQTTFWTTETPVIEGEEVVYVDWVWQERDTDYTIDYETGNITFTTAPGVGSLVAAFYRAGYIVTVHHVTEGPFLKGLGGEPIFVSKAYNDEGTVKALGTFEPPYPTTGASDPGVLATIEFLVIGTGVSALDLQNTKLLTLIGVPPDQVLEPVAHTAEDGVFDNRTGILPPNAFFNVEHPNMSMPVAGLPITFDASESNDSDDLGWIVSYDWDFGEEPTYADKWFAVGLSMSDTWMGDGVTRSFITSEKPIVGSEMVFLNESRTHDYTIDYETGNITLSTAPEVGTKVKVDYLYVGQKSFVTSEKPVVLDSEAVFVDEVLMTKDVDYTMDYTTGTITFNTAPGLGAIIEAVYRTHPLGSGMITTHTYAKAGTYTVSLTVTDNDDLSDLATAGLTVVEWVGGGELPDLVGWEAKPERPRLNERPGVRGMNLTSLVGNPSEDYYDVYVEFMVYSKDEGYLLGILTTPTVTLEPGENKRELSVYFDLTDPRWECLSGAPEWLIYTSWLLHKHLVFATCYYSPVGLDEFTAGFATKDFNFNVVPAAHDIAIIGLTINATNGVPEGSLLEINVTMENQEALWEPFEIEVTYKGYTTDKQTLEVRPSELDVGQIKTETFYLNTTGLTAEPFLIRATLSSLIYEDDVDDNTATVVIEIIA